MNRVHLNRSEKTLGINCELILLRHTGNENRKKALTLNLLTDDSLFKQNILVRSCPPNGVLGDLQIFLGDDLR